MKQHPEVTNDSVAKSVSIVEGCLTSSLWRSLPSATIKSKCLFYDEQVQYKLRGMEMMNGETVSGARI